MAYQQRGLEEKHERFHRHVIRDTRTLSVRIADFMKNPKCVGSFLIVCGVLAFVMCYFADIIFLIALLCYFYCNSRKANLPFRLPMSAHLKDYNDLVPGTADKPKMSRGIYYFGNENRTNNELWFSNEDMRTHVLIFGSTGSGKTEALVSMAYNALLQASGFIYVDGKGDNALFSKIFSMVREMGREDDLLLINFMTGARDIIGPQEKRLSNTLNPFANGSSSMLAQLIISQMEKAAGTPDGDMWRGRAISFVEALMRILVPMRDAGHVLLDANTIRNYFHFPRLETMVCDKIFIRDGEEPISLEHAPDSVMEPITNYVLNLPGFNKEKKGNQVSQVLEQHGFITMQLTRVFTSLADTYGHIMRTKLAEVDLRDVVLNRRILCVLLPALEKSPDELSNLGKIIISTLKAMMAAGLGEHVEGEYRDLITAKPTNSKTPYLCILDEYGYYAVEGFAVVPAQARSLGFSVVFAGQDLPAFQKGAKKEEAASIGANCNIKICMKLEDPTETWEFFTKSAGESYVTHVDSFQVDQGNVMGTYQDAKGARVEKRQRLDLLDLKEQREGDAHFFFKSKIVRGRFFHANPKPTKKLRLNHFLKVDEPSDATIEKLQAGFKQFELITKKPESAALLTHQEDDEMQHMMQILNDNQHFSPLERSMQVISNQERAEEAHLDDFLQSLLSNSTSNIPLDHVTLFTELQMTDHLRDIVIAPNLTEFKRPLLDRVSTRDQIEYIQRLCGRSSQKAMSIAIEIIADMEKGTHYPPKQLPPLDGAELSGVISDIISGIALKKQEAQQAEPAKT